MGKLINRIPGSCLLISSLPGLALRMHVNRSASIAMSTSLLKALLGKLDIKRHSPSILYFPALLSDDLDVQLPFCIPVSAHNTLPETCRLGYQEMLYLKIIISSGNEKSQ